MGLPLERIGQHDATETRRTVRLVLTPDDVQMLAQRATHGVRQHHTPILGPLAPPDRNLATFEVDVLDAQFKTLLQAKPGAIQQRRHECRNARQFAQHTPHLIHTEHDRYPMGLAGSWWLFDGSELDRQYSPVQEQHRTQGLVLRRGGHSLLHSQYRQERRDLGRSKHPRMPLTVKQDIAPNPMDVRLLRAPAVVTRANGLADLIQQFRGLR